MSGESDLINLYSERILELATNVPHVERLDTRCNGEKTLSAVRINCDSGYRPNGR